MYNARRESELTCEIKVKEASLEELREFKYLGFALWKYNTMEGEIRERSLQGRRVLGELESVIRGRNMSWR